MNSTVRATLDDMKLGKMQAYRDLCVFPVLTGGDEGPDYLALEEAMGLGQITITEIDEGGSVPELGVVNRAGRLVLLLDGEELKGAKQNRVLNTTVLLAPNSKAVLPVSCTEQGRWSYESPEFSSSDIVMDHQARRKKMSSVSISLQCGGGHESNQGEVWEEVAKFRRRAKVDSPTGAMEDVFTARKGDYDDCLEAFPLVEGQVGLIAFVGGRPLGIDAISRAGAFSRLHGKLIKSYASDVVMRGRRERMAVTESDARGFISGIAACTESGHPSVSLGEDFRYSSPAICGSALIYEKTCVHGAFFYNEEQGQDLGGMSSYRRRRSSHFGSDN